MFIRDEKSVTVAFRSLLNPALDSSAGALISEPSLADLLLKNAAERTKAPIPSPGSPPKASLTKASPSAISPRLLGLVHAMVEELDQQRPSLLKLNPSRRIQITDYLERIALIPSAQKTQLQDWVMGNVPHPRAMALYLEEVALITLAQICILKRWSEMGIRPFEEAHLGKVNWELSHALRPYIPLQREGWHLTRPNLYSWYTPSPALQKEIFETLSSYPLVDEAPSFVSDLCREGRRFGPDLPEQRGYDPRFYSELANGLRALDGHELLPNYGRRKKNYYSPTLRFGEIAHHLRDQVQWIGFEENLYSLLVAEVVELWSGPKTPPAWNQGNSLEAHPREQMLLTPSPSVRTGVLQMLTDMEACEIGFILEEKSLKASRLRAQLDSLPFFRKIRASGTSLGTLQACVGITKIRPGGKLLWAREEPISPDEGGEALAFILGRSRLVAEWNLAGIEHSLPSRSPLFPKYLYLFERENDSSARNSHRPKRVYVRGTIRSHIEVPLLLEDVLTTLNLVRNPPSRTSWNIQVHESPIPQKEWSERWPDQACVESLKKIEKLQEHAVPLAQVGTIRSGAVFDSANARSASGATLIVTCEDEPRRLKVFSQGKVEGREPGRALAIILSEPDWAPALVAYLESAPVQAWMEHYAEKRSDRWHLTETVLKLLPIPAGLISALETSPPQEHSRRVQDLSHQSQGQLERMPETGWNRFVLLARARDLILRQEMKLQPMTRGEAVNWSTFIRVFSRSDCSALTQNPGVRLEGRLPPNSPIARIERLKGSQAGISFMTDRLETLKVIFESRLLQQIVWDQVKDLRHPTWSEVITLVQTPRSLEIAESTAQELCSAVTDLRARSTAIETSLKEIASRTLGF